MRMNFVRRHLSFPIIVFCLSILGSHCIFAQDKPAASGAIAADPAPPAAPEFSIGLASGNQTGLWLEYGFAHRFGLQGLLAWDLVSPGGPCLSFDALYYLGDDPSSLSAFPARTFNPYLGLGIKATYLVGDGLYGLSDSRTGLTVRLPLGLRWGLAYSRFEAILELSPGLRVYPESAFDLDAAIGLRYRLTS